MPELNEQQSKLWSKIGNTCADGVCIELLDIASDFTTQTITAFIVRVRKPSENADYIQLLLVDDSKADHLVAGSIECDMPFIFVTEIPISEVLIVRIQQKLFAHWERIFKQ